MHPNTPPKVLSQGLVCRTPPCQWVVRQLEIVNGLADLSPIPEMGTVNRVRLRNAVPLSLPSPWFTSHGLSPPMTDGGWPFKQNDPPAVAVADGSCLSREQGSEKFVFSTYYPLPAGDFNSQRRRGILLYNVIL